MAISSLPSTRILVVDDHSIVREGICSLLNNQNTMTVVGSSATCGGAIIAAQQLKPDVIVMDLMLPDMNGIDATERILSLVPLTRIIVLSACRTIEHVYRALRAGANGYVVKDAPGVELVEAIKAVVAGRRFLSSGLTPNVDETLVAFAHAKSPRERLTFRERDVLHRIVAGHSSAVIGHQMSLSPKTIDTYRGRMMVKLGVRNRSGLIRFAIEHELAAV